MRFSRRPYVRVAFYSLVLILLAAWLVPYIFSAERYRRRLEAGLERALRRRVTFSAIKLRLLPRPGLEIEGAVVREAPAFGDEPFARIGRIQCDLKWQSLWRSRLEFSRLRLERPSFNLVRNAGHEWNVEDLLLKSGMMAPGRESISSAGIPDSPGALGIELADARINFKIGATKKAFAVTDVRGRMSLDPARRSVEFRLAGNPIRTDLAFPSPGAVELTGEWSPGKYLDGSLDAALRTRGALLYDWIPLVTGKNPGIYGVIDADIRLTGSIRVIKVEGESSLSQIRRWEQVPPSDTLVSKLDFHGQVDRGRERALIESLDATFAGSRIHLAGSLDRLSTWPDLDLVVAVERSRAEDFLALARRLWVRASPFGISGRMDGLLTIQGPWGGQRYGGFLGVRQARLSTPGGTFPVSELALRIEKGGARLAPVRVTLAPHVELSADASLEPRGGASRYEVRFSTRSVPLRDLVSFGRALGGPSVQGLEAQGQGTLALYLAGSAWPLTRPTVTGHVEIRAGRLMVAGLTKPIQIPRARIQFNGDQVVAEPLEAAIGATVFSGRLKHRGERKQPWEFDLRADNLSLEQGALWFDVLGPAPPRPLLDRLTGLRSLDGRGVRASNLFGALNAKGRFSARAVTYRMLALRDFRASVEISGRMIRVVNTTFRAGDGRGQGLVLMDLNSSPAWVMGEIGLTGFNLRPLDAVVPDVLKGINGTVSGTGHFETRGLTRQEMSAGLEGKATLRAKNVSFASFDPLDSLVIRAGAGSLEPARAEANVRSAVATLEFLDRRVFVKNSSLDVAGAKINLAGTYGFDGNVDLDVRADLRHLRRHWMRDDPESSASRELVNLHLAGPLNKLAVVPEEETFARRSVR